ncbi:MAG: RNA methyltransferase [Myxococcales bacterium]|nr:MAG: RNA methyltransferase [Myxococcales bacterium]
MEGRLVAGLQPVREAIVAHGRAVRRVSIEHGDSPRLEAVARFAADHGVAEVTREPRALLDALTEGTVHQGVVAWAPELALADFAELLRDPALLGMVLDGISDPQNFGAVVRSAVGIAASAVIWGENASAPLSLSTFRASAGAVEHAKLCRVPSLTAALTEAVASGVQVVGLDPQADKALRELDLKQPTLLVLGSEGEGMSRSVRRALSATARLAQSGRIGSLNASVAAAIALYEASNQRVTS